MFGSLLLRCAEAQYIFFAMDTSINSSLADRIEATILTDELLDLGQLCFRVAGLRFGAHVLHRARHVGLTVLDREAGMDFRVKNEPTTVNLARLPDIVYPGARFLRHLHFQVPHQRIFVRFGDDEQVRLFAGLLSNQDVLQRGDDRLVLRQIPRRL